MSYDVDESGTKVFFEKTYRKPQQLFEIGVSCLCQTHHQVYANSAEEATQIAIAEAERVRKKASIGAAYDDYVIDYCDKGA
jgi:hypothetical protein